MTLKVLIADDQEAVRTALQVLFEIHGHQTLVASTPEEALHFITTEDVGVVVQDMNFVRSETSGDDGIALFRAIRGLDPDVPVLLMTAFSSLETAVTLVKEGAADYIAKPWNDAKLIKSVENLLRIRQLELENTRLKQASDRTKRSLAGKYDLRGLVYESAEMQAVVSLAVHVAPSDAPVLVTGPNGSGKEKIAEIIQANSRRAAGPFVRVNAGGLPDELLEAELFGAEAGAFTGATKLRVGRFEAASGGTLFLDEIGNLSLAGQAKLLRVLQTGELERLGSSRTIKTDVRIVSATNVDLKRAIAAGQFREDLYFRLNVIELAVPALAARTADIVPLAETFLAQHAPTRTFGEGARNALLHHDWPGNVRELQNRVQRAALVAAADAIQPEDLGLGGPRAEIKVGDLDRRPPPAGAADPERAVIERALLDAGGVVSKAALALGVSRQALYRRMERLGLTVERKVKL